MVFSANQIGSALARKGFGETKSHHRMFYLLVNGKPSRVRTFISHGATEYGAELMSKMARQLHLRPSELKRLVECTMDEREYKAVLKARGVL